MTAVRATPSFRDPTEKTLGHRGKPHSLTFPYDPALDWGGVGVGGREMELMQWTPCDLGMFSWLKGKLIFFPFFP